MTIECFVEMATTWRGLALVAGLMFPVFYVGWAAGRADRRDARRAKAEGRK